MTAHDALSGERLWRCDLEVPATWVGRHAGLVLAGSPGGVTCLDEQGRPVWHYRAPSPLPLLAFAAGDGLLFFLQGREQLFALDADTGRVVWTRRAPASFLRWPDVPGRFGPDLRVDGRVLSLTRPCWQIDTATGELLAEGEVS